MIRLSLTSSEVDMRLLSIACIALALTGVAAPLTSAAPGVTYQTAVEANPTEDLVSPCRYELTLLDPSKRILGVWVIFDRGRDMLRYYGDPDVSAFARRHDLALLYPFHCGAKTVPSGDISGDPASGLGRALFTALSQFADRTVHPELASAKLILLGFSGTGALVARFPGFAPERVLAAIDSNPGHFDPFGVDTIQLSREAATVPQLIIVGGDDAVSGTGRPYEYFRRHFDNGAPWTFVVQNNVPHCCVINAKALVLQWLEAVAFTKAESGTYGFIQTSASEHTDCESPVPPASPIWCHSGTDTWGGTNWSVTMARTSTRRDTPSRMLPAGWLPNVRFAAAWLKFVLDNEHPVTSLP